MILQYVLVRIICIFLLRFWSTALLAVCCTSIRVPRRELLAIDQRGRPMLDFCELRNTICQVFYRAPGILVPGTSHQLYPRGPQPHTQGLRRGSNNTRPLQRRCARAWSRRQGVCCFVWFPRTVRTQRQHGSCVVNMGLFISVMDHLMYVLYWTMPLCFGGGSSPVDKPSALKVPRPRCL